jgi:hypothetical protein
MTHYQRWRRTGSTVRPTQHDILMRRVEWDDGCLVDPHCRPGVYPLVGKRKATHIVLEHHGHLRPRGAHALHSCDRTECVNIEHLRWGTHAENMADMAARKRACTGRRKLTDDDLDAIRADARPRRIIAKQYGIHVNTVGQIKARTHGYG